MKHFAYLTCLTMGWIDDTSPAATKDSEDNGEQESKESSAGQLKVGLWKVREGHMQKGSA
jgi:hypothetical protein